MHILLVIDGMHPRSGGPPAVIAGSAIALRKRGHDVSVMTTVNAGEEAIVRDTWAEMLASGVKLHFCAPEGVKGLLIGSTQADLIAALIRAADVVHLHGVWNPILVVTGRVAKQLRVPYFISVHGVFDRRAMERIRSKWLKKRIAMVVFNLKSFLDHAAGVLFGSEPELEQSWMPSAAMRVDFVPNGVDVNLGTMAPTASDLSRLDAIAPARIRWNRTILCRSRVHEEKGIDLLVQSFNAVAPDFPGTGLLIAGMQQDTAYEARIVDRIASGPVADRIIFTTALTGPSSQFLYQCCDIFAMPSIAEGFSMALIEGLANGRPMLITRYCHMPTVRDAGAGVIVESEPSSIADGLRRILALNDAELAAMGAKGRALFEDRYTWDRVAEMLEKLYGRAMASNQL